jgi:flagellar P-ring protein precursor FlgI
MNRPPSSRFAPAAFPVSRIRVRWRIIACVALSVFLADTGAALASSRIKDTVDFEDVRDNLLVGYGLVVGLDGTGDTLNNAPFTRQSLIAMLERLGVNTRNTNINTDNVAAVMVAANLPPFVHQGTRIDITVSSLGDADSLLGGTLLLTPLMAAYGEVYAVAQGNLVVGTVLRNRPDRHRAAHRNHRR